jgi:hypothetical protein
MKLKTIYTEESGACIEYGIDADGDIAFRTEGEAVLTPNDAREVAIRLLMLADKAQKMRHSVTV